MKRFLAFTSVLVLSILVFVACKKDKPSASITEVDLEYNYQFRNSTSAVVNLGRVLFYDKGNSVNKGISCGSCHEQSRSFTDNKVVSPGFDGRLGDRNTPSIITAGMQESFFWDGRENFLDSMAVKPFFNHVEMGVPNEEFLINSIKANPMYKDLFQQAFHTTDINMAGVQRALAAFMTELSLSNQQNFEIADRGEKSAEVQRGEDLFNGTYNCNSCHAPFSPNGYSGTILDNKELILTKPNLEPTSNLINIGLDNTYADKGAADRSGNAEDNGKFKVPSLRNVALTAPYMHDGRFKTLEEVIDFYSDGVKNHPNLDDRLKDGLTNSAIVFNIPEQDKKDLIAFLNSLTDNTVITDPRWSNPFKSK